MASSGSDSPDRDANQDDAVWLDLVARLEGDSPERNTAHTGTGTGDAPEGHDDPAGAQGRDPAAGGPGRHATFRDFDPLGLAGAAPAGPSGAAPPGPRDYGVPADADGFIPEEPPSLAGTDPLTMLAWLGAVGAPVALLLSTMFWRSAPVLAIWGMVAAFILAVVYLIMKLPQEKDENDDGARV